MADAAAFFAKKKKKKKTFKFNANTIDASQVTNTVHVDAPAISKSDGAPATGALPLQSDPANDNTDDGWDDAALAAKTRKGVAVVVPAGVTTKDLIVETKALSLKTHTGGDEQKDIANKLRIEETKAKLAAAKKGMEDEALRLKEAKLAKEEGKAPTSNRFGAAAGAGGKWVSRSRAAGSGGGSLSSVGWGSKMASSGFQRKVDTEDENLFPDLASADAILEKQKAEQPAYKAVTKTPVGGGATWGASRVAAPVSRPKLNLKKKAPVAASEEPAKEEEPQEPVATEVEAAPAETATTNEAEAAPEAVAAAPAPLKLKPKKKKKKDLSTFGKK